MQRSLGENGKEAFRESTHAYIKDFEASVKRRRRDMDEEWRDIDAGWAFVEKRMTEVGVKPAARQDCLLRLDVGGEPVDLWRTSLSEVPETKKSRLTALLEGVWDDRLPRLSNGRIVLDESPSCFKRLLEIQLGERRSLDGDQAEELEKHDEPYTKHLACFLRLNFSFSQTSVVMRGGSVALKDEEHALVSPQLHRWLSSVWTTPHVNLLYRASVHSFNVSSFHARCDGAASTIMLIRVRSSSSPHESVVGAFSSAPWIAPSSTQGRQLFKRSPDNFIFLLKDGYGGAPAEKWPIDPRSNLQRGCGKDEIFFRCCFSGGSCQKHALRVHFSETKGNLGSVSVDSAPCYFGNTPSARAFLGLNGAKIVELEVFSELPLSQVPGAGSGPPAQVGSSVHSADLRTFGVSMAGCLMRERRAIEEARGELASAGDKVEAAAEALRAVYGPDVAAGVGDPVVELNVRGKSMTTLRSTLRVCPESALAARFNEDRWPPQSQDLDENGRSLVDCCPLCFRKVLDVLRIRNRAGWSRASTACNAANSSSRGGTSELQKGRLVGVSKPHRECFNTLVGMYFPGCETFITDLVAFLT